MMEELFQPHSNAPPARHNIESDSDSDFSDPEAGDFVPQRQRKPKTQQPEDKVTFEGQATAGSSCIVALDQAGELWSAGLKEATSQEQLIRLNEDVVGTLTSTGSVNLLCVSALHATHGAVNALAQSILQTCSPSSLQIIDGYEPETYLPGSPLEPPMRSLTAEQHPDAVRTEPFGIPNLLTGLSAALCSEADRADIPVQCLLLPCAKSGRPAGFYDPSSALSSRSVDPASLQALRSVQVPTQWQQLKWDAAACATPAKWTWLQRAEKERNKRLRAEDDHMYM